MNLLYKSSMKLILLLSAFLLCINTDVLAKNRKRKLRKKTGTSANTKPTVPPQSGKTKDLLLCANSENIPFWHLSPTSIINFPSTMQKPRFYRVLTYSESNMRAYLKNTPFADSSVKIIIPVFMNNTLECKTFQLSRTKTMDDALQAKYPEIMSFKGFEPGNPFNTIRIETSEKTASFMINYNNDVLFINPITENGKTYYATYSKNDPNFIKKEFEK